MFWMFLPLRKYAVFSGRAPRREFWLWVLFLLIAQLVLALIDSALGLGGSAAYSRGDLSGPGLSGASYAAATQGGVLSKIFAVAVVIPNIAVAVRRLHDVDRSGWWILLPFVAGMLLAWPLLGDPGFLVLPLGLFVFVALIVQLFWYCSRGTRGPNRFGPDPLPGQAI